MDECKVLLNHARLLIAEFKRTTSEQLAEANQRLSAAAAELDKAQEVNDYSEITSPSDGYVQQLSTNTIGGVVSPNQVIMAIVPDNAGILIEAQLENQDIGFVHESQEVEIKIAAFPFTRYGVLKGIVTSVSSDAVNDDKGQLRYNVYINLDQNYIMINEKKTPLNIGMQVTAEIKTGKRPIIDYFSSPLIQATTTSFKER